MSKIAIVRDILQTIYDERGLVDPEYLVSLASNETHPLHGEFTWDDREAGHKQRISEARTIIRSVKIKVVTDDETYSVRAYHALRNVGRDQAGYIPDIAVQEDPEQKRFLLQTMKRDWNAAKRRYSHMAEFWELVANDIHTEHPEAV